jgi:hypothetical protein
MRRLTSFGRFWYEFIVGDDWAVAAGVVASLALTAFLVRSGIDAWWLMPLAVVGILGFSLRRATRRR